MVGQHAGHRRAARQLHLAAQWLPDMEPEPRARGYRKWRKAVTRTIDWPDDDDDDDDDDD